METASAVYVQIKHQLLWASVPLLTCGWNIRCGKGQSRDYKWNRFRLFHQKSRMSQDAGDIPLDASKDTPNPARDPVKSPDSYENDQIEPPFHKALFQRFDLVLRLPSKGALQQSTKVLLSSPNTLWVLSTHQEQVNSASIENHGKRCD